MPNGNELADILRWGGEGEYQHEWYAGQELPGKWWETDFPYRKAEKMGYRLSPEETRRFQERTREKTLSEELADILKRPEVKMLDPLQRADLVDKIAKAQAVIAKREQEREKHEAEQLEIGRQKQMQQKVQDILQSDRVPAQKLTALTMIGIPVSDAQDMVWGKRVPGEETPGRATREAAPRARAEPEELAAALRPEEPREVQFRMVGGELIKEPAGVWEGERLTPEQRIAKREAELEEAEYHRTLAVKREHPEMLIPLEERKFKAELEEKKSRLELDWSKFGHTKEVAEQTADLARDKFLLTIKEYGLDVAKEKARSQEWWADFGLKDRESQEKAVLEIEKFGLEIEKFGLDETIKKHGMWATAERLKLDTKIQEETMEKWQDAKKQWTKKFGLDKATEMFDQKMRGLELEQDIKEAENDYEIEKLKEDHAWEKNLFDMGFKDKEFVDLSNRFWATLDFNKEKEETRAKEFGVEREWDKEKEANIMDRFEEKLKQEYKQLDLDMKRFGLTKEIEARIAKTAMLEYALDVKRLGHDEAELKWKRIAEKKEWWFKEEDLKLKNTQAQRLFKDLIHRISQDAKEFGLKEAVHKENIRQFDEKMKVEHKKLEGTPEAKIEIGGAFGADLSGLGAELQDEVIGYIKSTYNAKTGKLFFPNTTQMGGVGGFLFGREGERRKKEELGVNLPADEFVKKVARQPMWSSELKGWCIKSRYNENVWQGMCDAGAAEGVYISPEQAMEPSLWEKVTGWWPFGKEKKTPATVDFPGTKIYVDTLYERTKSMAEVERYLKEDVGITLDEYKEWLRTR